MSEDLAGRVLAAIEETEQIAREAATVGRADEWGVAESRAAPWGVEPRPAEILAGGKPILQFNDEYGGSLAADHIARQDPAATLIRCEADRCTVERHSRVGQADWMDMGGSQAMIRRYCAGCGQPMPCPDLLDRAKVYGVEVEAPATS